MGLILNIETSTKNCSISLAKNGIPYFIVEKFFEDYSHAEKIHNFIVASIEANLLKLSELDAICINKGPGSFTGLKIGTAVAKGLCYGLNKPLLSIDSLSLIVEGIHIEKGIIIPMIITSFNDIYISIFDENKTKLSYSQAINLKIKEYKLYDIFLLGNIVKKLKYIINIPVNYYLEIYPSSAMMASISYEYYKQKKFEKIETFEPCIKKKKKYISNVLC